MLCCCIYQNSILDAKKAKTVENPHDNKHKKLTWASAAGGGGPLDFHTWYRYSI